MTVGPSKPRERKLSPEPDQDGPGPAHHDKMRRPGDVHTPEDRRPKPRRKGQQRDRDVR